MTAQTPDKLCNDHPRVDFGDLRLYGLTLHQPIPTEPWLVAFRPPPFDYPQRPKQGIGVQSTACYRGYVAFFVLNGDGTLTLSRFEYETWEPIVLDGKESFAIDVIEDPVGRAITGDFWMVLRPQYFVGPTTYVPFSEGTIAEAQSEWVVGR